MNKRTKKRPAQVRAEIETALRPPRWDATLQVNRESVWSAAALAWEIEVPLSMVERVLGELVREGRVTRRETPSGDALYLGRHPAAPTTPTPQETLKCLSR